MKRLPAAIDRPQIGPRLRAARRQGSLDGFELITAALEEHQRARVVGRRANGEVPVPYTGARTPAASQQPGSARNGSPVTA